MAVPRDLLEILACPRCRGPVGESDAGGIICGRCCLCFPVRDGIPVMVVEEAAPCPVP